MRKTLTEYRNWWAKTRERGIQRGDVGLHKTTPTARSTKRQKINEKKRERIHNNKMQIIKQKTRVKRKQVQTNTQKKTNQKYRLPRE